MFKEDNPVWKGGPHQGNSEQIDHSRRTFLQKVSIAGSVFLFAPRSLAVRDAFDIANQPSAKLITRVTRPANLETPVSEFTSWITPNDLFFVRSHFGPPRSVALKDWRLTVTGDVQHSLELTLGDLEKFEEVTSPLLVQCAGNGRALYRPQVPGAQWEKGAVGNAEWTGVRLRDVLQKAAVGRKTRHVQLQGADRPLRAQTPLFIRSIPIEKALDSYTLLAYKMNGEPLPLLHGGPLRIVVPGWYGDHCVKWLTKINLQEEESEGFYMRTAYRMPKSQLPPGTPLNPADSYPLSEMFVKSLIVLPLDNSTLKLSEIAIQGVAFTGESEIARVEISTDGGTNWHEAQLGEDKVKFAWRLWYYRWNPRSSGSYTILSRGTDSVGNVQPEKPTWNPGGYLWNAIDRISVQITS